MKLLFLKVTTEVVIEGEEEVLVMMEMLGFMVVMVVLVGVVLLPLHIMEVDHTGVMEDMEEAMHMEPHMVMVVVAMEVSMDLVAMLMMVMVI